MGVTPYVVGQWVRGERFYGRASHLEEILRGNRDALWVLGTRRVGKTSLLKQVELLASEEGPAPDGAGPFLPLFWDFQGAENESDLHDGLLDALYDAMPRFEAAGIDVTGLAQRDLPATLARLRREVRGRGRRLLLLCDEAEELVRIARRGPRLLRRLGRALQAEGVRTVVASTIRLWRLADDGSSTPFFSAFTPPLPLRQLEPEEARALVRQSLLPEAARPAVDDRTVEWIRAQCADHPFLLQLLSERLLELAAADDEPPASAPEARDRFEQAVATIATDEMVSFFFASDLAMLGVAERRLLDAVERAGVAGGAALEESTGFEPQALRVSLQRLELLGYLRRTERGYRLANPFFRRWFATLSQQRRVADSGEPRPVGGGRRPARGSTDRLASADRPRSRIDRRYDIVARLGTGGSGDVYRVYDTLLRTEIALKLLRPEVSADEESVERLRREVVLARDLSHPNLLKVYHLGEDGGRHYLTMRLVDGPDLAEVLADRSPLPLGRASALLRKLAAALGALHRHGILHRDLKPSNILLDAQGEPLITDFGLARLQWAPGITRNGMFLGTPAYASPEQARGEPLDERSDLYALGVIFYEMVTGGLPFVGSTAQEQLMARMDRAPRDPRTLVPDLQPEVLAILRRCLEERSERRYGSAAEVELALSRLPT